MLRSRLLGIVALVGSSVVGSLGLLPATAEAQSSYSGAVYQVTFSYNCVSSSQLCYQLFGLGGLWGWAALMPASKGATYGTGNAQATECGHVTGGGGPGQAGAQHISFDPNWVTFQAPSGQPPTPLTPQDPNNTYIGMQGGPNVPPVPATYGHYTISNTVATVQITIAP
jgi:hypothetical protein